MKTRNILSTTILAIASAVLATGSAQAAQTYNNGDLLLSFRATGGQGASKDYVLDLGTVSNFLPTTVAGTGLYSTGSIVNIGGLAGLGADLTSLFTNGGPNWYTRGDLLWSVTGVVTGNPKPAGVTQNSTMFITSPEDPLNPGVQGTPQPTFSAGNSATPVGKLSAMANAFKNDAQTSAAPNAATGEVQDHSLFGANNYASFASGSYPTATLFNTFSSPQVENDFGSGAANSVVDLYRLNPGASSASLLGGFRLTTSGGVQFSSNVANFAPVPEPASAGLLGSAILGLLAMGKRRRAARPVQA